MSVRLGVLIAGAATAAIALAGCGDPLPLSTTDQGLAQVSPASWDYGSAQVGTEIGPRTFIASMGASLGSDTVLAITSCPDFRVDLGGNTLPYDIYRICD